MIRSTLFALMTAMLLTTAPSWAADGSGIAGGLAQALGGKSPSSMTADNPQVAGLVSALTEGLGVSKEQAIGGSGALLGMAKNQLDSGQLSQLTDQVPGLSSLMGGGGGGSGIASSMLGGLSSLSGVEGVFSSLGMSPDMISQFAPVILDYLSNQGVGQALLGQLEAIWTPR